jgi:hypothetical protein
VAGACKTARTAERRERDHLLQQLQLTERHCAVANAIGRHLKQVFELLNAACAIARGIPVHTPGGPTAPIINA